MEADGFYQSNYSAYEDPPKNNQPSFQPNYDSNQQSHASDFYQPNNDTSNNQNFYNNGNNNNLGNTQMNNNNTDLYGGGFEDEPPLLEELGIDFNHIIEKTKVVLNPMRNINQDIVNETDLAGPLVFAFGLASCLLLAGKMHFGYIYGISVFAVLMMWLLLKMMAPNEGPSFGTVTSILGYCLLPIVILSGCAILFSLQGVVGTFLSGIAVVWCSWSSSKLFCSALNMTAQQALVAYPCAMLYGVFALLAVF